MKFLARYLPSTYVLGFWVLLGFTLSSIGWLTLVYSLGGFSPEMIYPGVIVGFLIFYTYKAYGDYQFWRLCKRVIAVIIKWRSDTAKPVMLHHNGFMMWGKRWLEEGNLLTRIARCQAPTEPISAGLMPCDYYIIAEYAQGHIGATITSITRFFEEREDGGSIGSVFYGPEERATGRTPTLTELRQFVSELEQAHEEPGQWIKEVEGLGSGAWLWVPADEA